MPFWIPIGPGRSLNLHACVLVQVSGDNAAVLAPSGERFEVAGEAARTIARLTGLAGDDAAPDPTPETEATSSMPDAEAARIEALEAFEAAAKSADLRGDGFRQLLVRENVETREQLTAEQLRTLAAELMGPKGGETAADLNAAGFALGAKAVLLRAPKARRPSAHAEALEKAGERFGGDRLARIRATLDLAL